MNKMNTLAFVKFLLVKLFPILIHQNFPPSKFCAVWYNLRTQNVLVSRMEVTGLHFGHTLCSFVFAPTNNTHARLYLMLAPWWRLTLNLFEGI